MSPAPAPPAAKPRNPIEKRMAQLHDLWWESTYHPHLRAIVLRAPSHSQRMLEAFFALQQRDSEYATPDLFISFEPGFETGFSYSRALRHALIEIYEHNKAQFALQGITAPWAEAQRPGVDSAAGFIETGLSLARHLDGQIISAVLQPRRVSTREGFERWFDAAMQALAASGEAGLFRLVLLDDDDSRVWQSLMDRHAPHTTVVHAPVNMLDAAREVAAQTGSGGGAQVLYRQTYADMLTLLHHGDAPAVERKAQGAMQLARREGWSDQRPVIDLLVGSAWLKARDYPRAVDHCRAARASAEESVSAGSPVGRMLLVQSWMAEGGAWVAAGDMAQGARAFEQAAIAAKEIPHALFAVEGYRTAAQCWHGCGAQEKAMETAMLGIQEARQMAEADRPTSTVPQLLNDLLCMHDPRRCERIARCALDYEKQVLQAQTDADRAAQQLGPRPQGEAIKAIEERLLRTYEQAFQSHLGAREQLVKEAGELFQSVVALARQWLHPAWSGLPDVRHPLDLEVEEWESAPEFAVLPDPQALLEAS